MTHVPEKFRRSISYNAFPNAIIYRIPRIVCELRGLI